MSSDSAPDDLAGDDWTATVDLASFDDATSLGDAVVRAVIQFAETSISDTVRSHIAFQVRKPSIPSSNKYEVCFQRVGCATVSHQPR